MLGFQAFDALHIACAERAGAEVLLTTDDRFRKHAPAVYGTVRDDDRRQWILVLENLSGMVLQDSAGTGGWGRRRLSDGLRIWTRSGISSEHSKRMPQRLR